MLGKESIAIFGPHYGDNLATTNTDAGAFFCTECGQSSYTEYCSKCGRDLEGIGSQQWIDSLIDVEVVNSIAEKLMGWHKCDTGLGFANWCDFDGSGICLAEEVGPILKSWVNCIGDPWNPLGNEVDTNQVLDKLSMLYQVSLFTSNANLWVCSVYRTGRLLQSSEHKDRKRAVCLTALKVVGTQIRKPKVGE